MTIAELLASSGACVERRFADHVKLTLNRHAEIELSTENDAEGLSASEARALADSLRAFADASEAMLAPVPMRSAAE